MAYPRDGEVLTPRISRLASHSGKRGLLADENLDLLAHILDDWFAIRGTRFRFGLDGIVGLIPGVGDVLTGLLACVLLFAGWVRGLPYITLARMVVNIGIDVAVGSVPLIGDIFDIAWKANRRNYALLQRHVNQPRRHTWKDWIFLGLLVAAIGTLLLLPCVVLGWLIWYLRRGH